MCGGGYPKGCMRTLTVRTGEEVEAATESAEIARAAGGDAQAYERLYRRHVARVHGLARRMIGVELADEVTQDVFVRVWEKLDTFQGRSAFSTWLHRVAVNVILGRRAQLGKRRDRFKQDEPTLLRTSTRGARPDIQMDVERAVERLPPGAREVFVLYDVEGYKHREIAELLGISAGTSKSQLHEARMALREYLA